MIQQFIYDANWIKNCCNGKKNNDYYGMLIRCLLKCVLSTEVGILTFRDLIKKNKANVKS